MLDRRTLTASLLAALLAPRLATAATRPAASYPEISRRVAAVLAKTPLIDGHNDWPWALREGFPDRLWTLDLEAGGAMLTPSLQTDFTRLKAGGVGGQFWSVYVPVELGPDEAVVATLQQIDIVRQLAERHPGRMTLADSAADIRRIHAAGRVAALIGVEGGHQIGGSLAVLRQYRALGARYMTLTHVVNTPWADSATDAPSAHGLTAFGKIVIGEMNRLGMLVDLSHVSPETMRAALAVTQAPVIFSHSSARALCDHPRNVPDDVLPLVAANGGVVMVNFYAGFVSEARRRWNAARAGEEASNAKAPSSGLYAGQPERAAAALKAWEEAHPKPVVTLAEVADHIDHIARVAGVDHVGIGGDLDGVDGDLPVGLEGVDRYPALLAELMRRGWSDADIAKLAGGNILRVLDAADAAAARLKAAAPPADALFTPVVAQPTPVR